MGLIDGHDRNEVLARVITYAADEGLDLESFGRDIAHKILTSCKPALDSSLVLGLAGEADDTVYASRLKILNLVIDKRGDR